jgi:uncharacterized protein YbjT (DUF2867 family)
MESWPGIVVGGRALAGQPVVLVGDGKRRHAYIAEHDVAQFVVAAIGNPAARGRTLSVGGPAAVTWAEVLATYEQVLGRPIDVRFVKPGEHVEGIRDVLLQLLGIYDTFDTVFDTQPLAAEFGVALTPLDAWVRASTAAAKRAV